MAHPLMNPLVGGALLWALDRAFPKNEPAATLPPPPRLTSAQISLFTHARPTEEREIDNDVAAELEKLLEGYSLRVLDDADLAAFGRPCSLVPFSELEARSAMEMIRAARSFGESVVVSLSVVLLPRGLQAPVVVVCGSRRAELLARPGGHFAILPPPLVAESGLGTQKTERAAPPKPNGAAHPDDEE